MPVVELSVLTGALQDVAADIARVDSSGRRSGCTGDRIASLGNSEDGGTEDPIASLAELTACSRRIPH
jgi:hypothetical protein